MEKEIEEIKDSFNSIALEVVHEEFTSFKATIEGKYPVVQVNTFLEHKLNYLSERLKERFIQFAEQKNTPLSKTFLDELIYTTYFYQYREYLHFSFLGLLKERKIEF